jgi:spermidine synthase
MASRPGIPRSAYFALFTISGFAGLIYESIWSHYLKLFLGHAAYAQTLVLALFMGGMAIGSALCSRWSGNWTNLLRGYAIAEALIGLAALAFHPLFVAATELSYSTLLPALGTPGAASAFKWTLAGLLILPQSILLGTTFPLMTAGLLRRYPGAPGESLSMLYFTNSLGAAVGVLAAGFIMIDALGLPGTLHAAGYINLLLAAAVWIMAGQRDGNTNGAAANAASKLPDADVPWSLFLWIGALTGAASFIYEIAWIRMLSLVLGSSTHSFELMLSAFILGLACGGLWIRRRIDRITRPIRFLAFVQIAMGLLALATLALYGEMFSVMQWVIQALAKSEAGYKLFLLSSHGIALAIMFPATFCAGMTLPLITYTLLRAGYGERSIGAVYASNTLGSIAGVFAAAHIGLPMLGLKGSIAAGAAIDVLLGLVLLWRIGATRLNVGAAMAVAAAFVIVLGAVQLDNYKMASGVFRRGDLYAEGQARLVSHEDGKTTTVSLMDFGTDRSLRTNGKSDGAINMDPAGPRISDELTMTLTAALPLAHKPDAKHAAIIGIGTGLTTHTMLGSPTIETVDTIEIEPAMAAASRLFAPRNANAFADPRSRIVFEDAKTFFSTHNRKYDIIISEPSNPWVSGVSSLFTGEFYRLVRRHLQPDGVLVQWFQLYEIDLSLVASVLRALGDNFPDYVIYAATSGDLLIIAGDGPSLSKPLHDVTGMPGVARELRRVHVQSMDDLALRRLGDKSTLGPLFASYDVPANSDFYPYLDLHAAKYRFLQQSASELTRLGIAPVPAIAMLGSRAETRTLQPSLLGEENLEKAEHTRRARYAYDFFLSATPPEPLNMPRQFQKDLELARTRLLDCREPEKYDVWLHALYSLARTLNPLLSPAEAGAVWDRLMAAPCSRALSTEQRAWLALFQAVGRRDAQTMASQAESLLAGTSGLPAGHREYLLAAGMAGHLAQGHRDRAANLWNRFPHVLSSTTDLSLRLLHAHAFGK